MMPVEMHPSQIRAWLLREHEDLRKLATSVHDTAQRVVDGDEEAVGTMRELCAGLSTALGAHLDLEDAVLAPALRETDAFGPDRADALVRHHAEQRRTLEGVLSAAADPGRDASETARQVQAFVADLKRDVDEEDRDLLHPNLLKDDPILVDGFTG